VKSGAGLPGDAVDVEVDAVAELEVDVVDGGVVVADVEVVSIVDAAPHDTNRTAPTAATRIRFIIPTVYGSSGFAPTGAADADEREVCPLYFGKPVGRG